MTIAFTRRRLLLAATAMPAGIARAADAAPTDLRFADFFRRPVGPRGLEIGPALAAAHGRRVRLVGYMVAQESPRPGQLLLAPLPLRMSEHADGEADDLPPQTVTVWLHPSLRALVVPHREGPLTLVGRLEVGRQEADDGRVSWVRLHLDADAVQAEQAAALAR